jgi:hypothetical protein
MSWAAVGQPPELFFLGWRKELDDMSVWITEKKLHDAIGPRLGRAVFRVDRLQVLLPKLQALHAQSEMIAPVVRVDWIRAVTDQMKLLGASQSEPCTGKGKGRSRDAFQPQNIAIESAAPFDILDVQCHVI